MFHVLCLVVNLVPVEFQCLDEKGLDQVMTPDDSHGEPATGSGQVESPVRLVFRQPGFTESLCHAGDGPGGDSQGICQLSGGDRLFLLTSRDQVDRLDIVFNRQAGHGDDPRRGRLLEYEIIVDASRWSG